MTALKLIALDSDDLDVIGAHLQDAVVRIGDLAFLPRERRFVGLFNRFAWEAAERLTPERHRTGLRIEGVTAAKRAGLTQKDPSAVLNLLDMRFTVGEAPAGTIDLIFSGGGVIRLDVDYIEVAIDDTGAAWAARAVPQHDQGDTDK